MSSKSSFRLNIFNIYHTTGLIRNATSARYSTSSSSTSSTSPVVPVQWQCRGSALYRSGNLLIITPPQDSVLSSNNTNSSVMFNLTGLNYYSHFSSLFPDFFSLSCSTPQGASFLIKKNHVTLKNNMFGATFIFVFFYRKTTFSRFCFSYHVLLTKAYRF